MEEARDMLSMPDMADMAEDELKRLETQKEEQENELKLLLIPKDPGRRPQRGDGNPSGCGRG